MKSGATSVLIASIGLLSCCTPAFAQSIQQGQGVADRTRPDYDPFPHSLGSFYLFPSVAIAANATDNYRATNTNRKGDIYFVAQPNLEIKSNWARNRLDGNLYYSRSLHANLPSENVSLYGGSASSSFDITRQTQLRADVAIAHTVESRSSLGSFQGSADPVSYDNYRVGFGGSQRFNQLVLNGTVGGTYTNYHDTLGFAGNVIDQDYRDVRELQASGSVQYELKGGIGLIATATVDQSRYSFRPGKPGFISAINTDRASSGLDLQGGITLELSSLIFGNIQFGYLSHTYRDPRLRDFSGLSFNANVLWNVTPLTSLGFHARRSVEDTSSTTVAGNTRSEFGVKVDHELYRYIILTGSASISAFKPNGQGASGTEYAAGIGAVYLIDRRWSLTGALRYGQRSATSSNLRYNASSALLSVKVSI